MSIECTTISYKSTLSFSALANDYAAAPELFSPFVAAIPNWDGLTQAIASRATFDTPREVLHNVLTQQYAGTQLNVKQQANLDALLQPNTFTITTAHQPNLFTGPLYFIYKILHAIKLADACNARYKDKQFVPVYYMGSEDADKDELDHFYIEGEKYQWKTNQTGAVGRMRTEHIQPLIDQLRGQFGFLPHGLQVIDMLEHAFLRHTTIAQATFSLVNALFAEYGLLIIIPDNAQLKALYAPVLKKELTSGFSGRVIGPTIDALSKMYKVQAAGREINLFYLFDDGRRERIEKTPEGDYRVLFSDLRFTEEEILHEVDTNPERFSPNVILRGLFQETILPNVAFIGGGAEIAYWLELKGLFEAQGVPYPVLVLRNSFLLLPPNAAVLRNKLSLSAAELFLPLLDLQDMLATRMLGQIPHSQLEADKLKSLYASLAIKVKQLDASLAGNVAAQQAKAIKGLEALDKKIQRAARRRTGDAGRQAAKLKQMLFPNGALQERLENFIPFYAAYGGQQWLRMLYDASLTLEQQFSVAVLHQPS